MMSEHWILLFDPFHDLLNTCQSILAGEGYQVETAFHPEEASRLCKLRRYSAILIAYFPPFERIGRLIQSEKQNSPETYQIVVTDLSISDSPYERLFQVGVDEIISKTYSPERILTHLKKGWKQRDLILRKGEFERKLLLDPVAQKIGLFIFKAVFFKGCLRQELKKAKRQMI